MSDLYRSLHRLDGRLCSGYDEPTGKFTTITVCSCGLSFIGRGVDEADAKWVNHARPLTAAFDASEASEQARTSA